MINFPKLHSQCNWKKPFQAMKDSFENTLSSSEKSNLLQTEDANKIVNKTFSNFIKINIIGRYSRITTEMYFQLNATIKQSENWWKSLFLERSNANWIDVISSVTKKWNKIKHSSTKSTVLPASFNENERNCYRFLIENTKKRTEV